MNVADEASRSCWLEAMPAVDAPPLAGEAQCELVVIGSGIAGLSAAYEAARSGRRVLVIDRGWMRPLAKVREPAEIDPA